ncbi:transcription factor [Ganoderma sinense ZZ0214-1]|uniref:Transcription factor n=1 Tax=Ganoderma sinense ZZ0214-1 TaxID=1077348 RepID=A0A2G8S073_9APHY|nr:transcription factor [Ganoderma sinense ZZ0214-1]
MSPQSISKLTDDNYSEWSVAMEALLVKRGLWEVTCDPATKTRPAGSDNTKAVRSWRAKITEARAEIILNLDPSQYAHIQSPDAHEVWTELRRVHLARGFGTRMAHRRALWRMAKRADQPMTAWIADVRRAAFRLEEIGAPVSEEDRILVVTNGLPDSYSQLIVTLDSTPPDDLTLENVITRLLNEEARQTVSKPAASRAAPSNTLDVAFTAATKARTPIDRITCFKCSKKGHYQRDCPGSKDESANVAYHANLLDSPTLNPARRSDEEDEIVAW